MADTILVLEQGRLVQRGTHRELLEQPGLYRRIYDLQLRDQEGTLAEQALHVHLNADMATKLAARRTSS
jgi:hypothetical protein